MRLSRICGKTFCNLLLLAIFMVIFAMVQKVILQSAFTEKTARDISGERVYVRGHISVWTGGRNESVTEHKVVRAWDVTDAHCSANTSLTALPWFAEVGERTQQFLLYRHCRYYPMIFNHPEKCEGDVYLLLVIKSMIPQHRRREAIRKTWGEQKKVNGKKVRLVFLVGAATLGEEHVHHQKLLEYEDRLFGDILQWDFKDTFYNLTLKEVNFLKWFSTYCPNVPFVFKGDDDIFVNVENIVEFLEKNGSNPDLIVGTLLYTSPPVREKNNRYFVPAEMFNETFYPPYLSGGGYLMAGPLTVRLHLASERVDLLPIDDAFVGMCLRVLHVSPKEHSGIKPWGIHEPGKKNELSKNPCFYRDLLMVHRFTPGELLLMWKIMKSDVICSRVKHFG